MSSIRSGTTRGADGRRLFSVNGTSAGAADIIGPAADTATAHIRLTPGYADLPDPRISADGTRLYVADSEPSGASVLAFDTTSVQVPAPAPAPRRARRTQPQGPL
ncbi:hypothetical protein [Kitasatospora sp. NPDC056531]|uniref:hypothetical protein n=1 Tax=Kitasatospora sp. NPDC056531 TaxID=3345856 RepID=UPI0036764386